MVQLFCLVRAWNLWRVWHHSVLEGDLSKSLRNTAHIGHIFWNLSWLSCSTLGGKMWSHWGVHVYSWNRCLLLVTSLITLDRAGLYLLVFYIGSPDEFPLGRLLIIILFLRCQLLINWNSWLGQHLVIWPNWLLRIIFFVWLVKHFTCSRRKCLVLVRPLNLIYLIGFETKESVLIVRQEYRVVVPEVRLDLHCI